MKLSEFFLFSRQIPQHGSPTPNCLCDRKEEKNFSTRRREENWQDILKIGKLDWSEGKGNFSLSIGLDCFPLA